MQAVIVGIGSDIGQMMARRLIRDEWRITGVYRKTKPDFSLDGPLPNSECVRLKHISEPIDDERWDLLICCQGALEPESSFFEANGTDWDCSVHVNALSPLRWVRKLYPHRNPNALVVFFGGTNPNKPAINRSAYHLSKIMLIAAAEQLDAESPDCRFVCIGPGYLPTKIHKVRPELKETNPDDLYDMLTELYKLPKECTGRNFSIKDDWRSLRWVGDFGEVGKLRRHGNEAL
jgi:NAD(P)-dependent dehydrogenase (short-subunit alcohol dehydrogenase family)